MDKNIAAVDATLENLHQVDTTGKTVNGHAIPPAMSPDAPDYVQNVLGKMMCGEGDSIPVSQMPVDGTFPNGTSQYEKRNLALDLPEWDPTLCIQCGKCTAVCPHAVIRSKFFSPDALANAPEGFECLDAKHPDWKGEKFVIQISPNDCTGCTLCADVCPAKSKTDPTHKALTMVPAGKIHDKEEANWNFFLSLPDVDRTKVRTDNIRSMQVLRPLFEFSGACAGCGETPYVKMLSQLFGNRLVVANATGCSSIYGGNLPTTPWSHDSEGRGPAWANSLFEDNAEFGLGFRVSLDKQMEHAIELLHEAAGAVGQELVDRILANPQKDEADIAQQRENIEELKKKIAGKPEYARLLTLADKLVRKSVWILGLRHRLRRPGPHSGQRPEREGAGHGYGSILQHRRPVLQIHPARRSSQIRHDRQARSEKGSGPHGHDLRQRVRGLRRSRRQGRTHAESLCGSGSL